MNGISPRKRIWGWWFFDWASQPYHTLLVTFIFSPFFAGVAAEFFLNSGLSEHAADAKAQVVWSWCLAITGLIIGFGAPLIGALADTAGRRIPWIFGFSILYFVGAWALWYTAPDGSNMWFSLIAFGIGFIGAEYALIFVNSQLPSISDEDTAGEISGSGFAFGYLGGLLSLFILLLLFVEQANGKTFLLGLDPAFGLLDASQMEGTRAVGPITAVWFVIFMVPYFLWVRDDPTERKRGTFGDALGLLGKSLRNLKNRRSLFTYLGSSMFYRDALNGLYGFGGVYAKLVLDWEITQIGIFGILGLISAAFFSWIGGKLDKRLGPKPVIIGSVWVLILVCSVIVGMSRETIFGIALAPGSTLPDTVFMICGALIGGMGGMLQAASRTLMVRHTDPAAPTESFGLYGLSGRATAFIAPTLIGVATYISESARYGVSPVILLFLIGLILLRWVKAEGDKETWSVSS